MKLYNNMDIKKIVAYIDYVDSGNKKENGAKGKLSDIQDPYQKKEFFTTASCDSGNWKEMGNGAYRRFTGRESFK